MASDQAVLDQIGNSWAIQHGSPVSSRQFYVSNYRAIWQILRQEQVAIRASGNTSRTITGNMNIVDITLSGKVSVPAKIMIGADGLSSGSGNGEDVWLMENQSGRILIAMAGSAVRKVSATTSGGNAYCIGASESLLIAFGGHAASPFNPPTMAYGTNGTSGGDGGLAIAATAGQGNVIYSIGGNGAKGTPGQIGRPAGTFLGWTFRPPGTPGTNGADGDGGDAISSGGDASDFYAQAGKTVPPKNPFPTIAGAAGTPGHALIIHGPIDPKIIGAINGDGTNGRVISR